MLFFSKSKDLCARYLSAFQQTPEPFEYNGREFDSIEAAFHYAKFLRTSCPELADQVPSEPVSAKRFSSKKSMKELGCSLDVGRWNIESVHVMRELVQKRALKDPKFVEIIKNTGDEPLLHFERGTCNGPPFWGCFRSKETEELIGVNMFGRMLMELRY